MNTTTLPARAAGQGTPGHVTIPLPGVTASARAARAVARGVLAGTGCPAGTESDVELVTAELASNAVRHSRSGWPGGTFELSLTVVPGESVRIEVRDQGPASSTVPRALPAAAPGAESGRGLHIVEELSAGWGHDGAGLCWALVAWAAA